VSRVTAARPADFGKNVAWRCDVGPGQVVTVTSTAARPDLQAMRGSLGSRARCVRSGDCEGAPCSGAPRASPTPPWRRGQPRKSVGPESPIASLRTSRTSRIQSDANSSEVEAQPPRACGEVLDLIGQLYKSSGPPKPDRPTTGLHLRRERSKADPKRSHAWAPRRPLFRSADSQGHRVHGGIWTACRSSSTTPTWRSTTTPPSAPCVRCFGQEESLRLTLTPRHRVAALSTVLIRTPKLVRRRPPDVPGHRHRTPRSAACRIPLPHELA